jgi:mono/diheme cytochrome c family protein
VKTALLLLSLALAGCDLSMKNQPRADPKASAGLWAGGPAPASRPDGIVSFEAATQDVAEQPPAPTQALADRGVQRYAIFCTPCHGASGKGDGAIVARGFPAPTALDSPAGKALSGRQLFDIIGHGQGVMYGFADRISPTDRWAIVLHIRSLQSLVADEPS